MTRGIRRRAGRTAPVTATALTVLLAFGVPACSRQQGSQAAFCREVRQAPDLRATLSGFSDADPAELGTRLTTAREAYERLRRAAPGPIRSDTREVVALVDDIIAAVYDHPDDPDAVVSQARRSVAARPGAAEAARSVTAYAARACNLELDPSGATTTTIPTTTATAVTTPTSATTTAIVTTADTTPTTTGTTAATRAGA